jgi:hypothetical protein
LSEDEKLPEQLIPLIIKEETAMLDEEGMKVLQGGYIDCYWQSRMDNLKFLEFLCLKFP